MARFNKWQAPKIIEGKLNKYYWLVQNIKGFKLGKNTDIGAFTYINALNKVTIEDNAQIGSHCSIYSTSTIDHKNGPVMIKTGACVGSHSTVMPGVTIGENALCGAHSFINKDIPANCLAYGVPVKIYKRKKDGPK